MFGRVAMGDGEGGGRNVERDELSLREFFGDSDGDAAGAGADVGDEESCAIVLVGTTSVEFAEGEAVERDFNEMFGFWARDENVWSDFECEAPEFLFAGEVLDGDAGDSAVEKILICGGFVDGELGFGMRIEIGALTACGVKEQQLGGQRVGRDVGSAELRYAVFECGAEGHGRRKSRFLTSFGMPSCLIWFP